MVLGEKLNAFATSGTNRNNRIIIQDGKIDDTVSGNTSVLGVTKDYNADGTPFVKLEAKAVGTAKLKFTYKGDNGYVYAEWTINVVNKFKWASNDHASPTLMERPKTSPYNLANGSTVTLYAWKGTGSDTKYSSAEAAALTWKSANTSLATLDKTVGNQVVVTGKGVGLVEIIATDSYGTTKSCWIQVYNAVTGITANSTPYLVGYHQSDVTKQMTYGKDYTLSPSNATYTSPEKFQWKSEDTSKAEVEDLTGLVTIHSSAFTGPVNITARPNPDGKLLGYKTARTVKVVSWKGYATASWSTSSGTLQSSDGTKDKEGIYHFVKNSTVKLDKDKQANIKFYNVLDKKPIGTATYEVTSSNTSIVVVSAYNSFASSNGNYVYVMPKATGKATITMKAVDDNHYFVMSFTVQVI